MFYASPLLAVILVLYSTCVTATCIVHDRSFLPTSDCNTKCEIRPVAFEAVIIPCCLHLCAFMQISTSMMARFSSDRTVAEYARDIWDLKVWPYRVVNTSSAKCLALFFTNGMYRLHQLPIKNAHVGTKCS